MKTFTIILTVLIAMTIETNAQIPNSGFETWENYVDDYTGYVYEKPDLWNGSLPNNSVYSFSIEKNPESYPVGTGQYSMKIQPDIANGVRGVAISNDGADPMVNWIPKPSFAINRRPASLYFYYKCFPFGGDTIIGKVYFYKNGVVIGNPVFGTTQTISSWTAWEVPMTYNTSDVPDSATIFFVTGAYIQHSESILYVDNLSFDTLITSVSLTSNELPIKFNLAQNYPNPFNPTTNISFTIPSRSFVTIKLFDIIGREITTLVSEELRSGNYSRQWNATNIPSGVYFYRLQAGSYIETKKLVLLR